MLVNTTTVQSTVSQRLVWIPCKPVSAQSHLYFLPMGTAAVSLLDWRESDPFVLSPGLCNHLTRALESQPDFAYFISSQLTVQTGPLKHGTGANRAIHLMPGNVTPPLVYCSSHPSIPKQTFCLHKWGEVTLPTRWNSPDVPGWIAHLSCVPSVFWGVPQTEIWMNQCLRMVPMHSCPH